MQIQNPFRDGRAFDAGDHLDGATALFTDFDLENAPASKADVKVLGPRRSESLRERFPPKNATGSNEESFLPVPRAAGDDRVMPPAAQHNPPAQATNCCVRNVGDNCRLETMSISVS
jgi:hypothetical protein